MNTAENITKEQIRALHVEETERLIRAEARMKEAREALIAAGEEARSASWNLVEAGVALCCNPGARERDARARCAAILNERAERAKERP